MFIFQSLICHALFIRCCPSGLQNSFRRAQAIQCSCRQNVQVSNALKILKHALLVLFHWDWFSNCLVSLHWWNPFPGHEGRQWILLILFYLSWNTAYCFCYADLMKLQHLKPTVNICMYPVMLDEINSEVYQADLDVSFISSVLSTFWWQQCVRFSPLPSTDECLCSISTLIIQRIAL